MSFQDVSFLPFQAIFSAMSFLNNSGRGDSLRTTTCPKTVVGGGKQFHASC